MQKIPQYFTVLFTVKKISEIFCAFLCKNICAMQKIPRFFYASFCGKIRNAKNATKICEKIYEKINGKNLLILKNGGRDMEDPPSRHSYVILNSNWNGPTRTAELLIKI